MASSGFVTVTTMPSGELSTTCLMTLPTMSMLVKSRSSRLMPGFRAMPDVTTVTSEPAVSA